MNAYTVGQEVNIHDSNRYRPSVQRGVVVKVGRKYVSVDLIEGRGWRPAQFHIDTGGEKTDFGVADRWIATDEQDAERIRIEAAQERLKAAGIRLSQPHGFGTVKLTVAQWEAIADIVALDGAA